jgi:hypothetical protein
MAALVAQCVNLIPLQISLTVVVHFDEFLLTEIWAANFFFLFWIHHSWYISQFLNTVIVSREIILIKFEVLVKITWISVCLHEQSVSALSIQTVSLTLF